MFQGIGDAGQTCLHVECCIGMVLRHPAHVVVDLTSTRQY